MFLGKLKKIEPLPHFLSRSEQLRQSLPVSVIIYIHQCHLSIMIEEMCNQSRIRSCCGIKDEDNNDVGFDKIVKFLNAQKAALDYADLN